MEFLVKNRTNGAAIGFEQELWAAADKMRGHMDPFAKRFGHNGTAGVIGTYDKHTFYQQHSLFGSAFGTQQAPSEAGASLKNSASSIVW